MDAIGLEIFRLVAETLQDERRERHAIALRHVRKRILERLRVIGPVVRRHAHADDQHACAGFLGALDHRAEVRLQLRDRQAAQAVVAAKLENHHRRMMLRQQLADARAPAGSGVAGDARIDDVIIEPFPLQPFCEQRHPALRAREAVRR